MTARGKQKTDTRKRGLPDEDDDLAALAAIANAAFPEPVPAAPRPEAAAGTAAPAPAGHQPEEKAQPQRAERPTTFGPGDRVPPAEKPAAIPLSETAAAPPAPEAAAAVSPPPAGRSGEDASGGAPEPGWDPENLIKQSTVSLDASVKQRVKQYQRAETPPPSNAEVIFRALDASEGRYRQIIEATRPQLPEGRRFGRAVAGRRQPGSRLTTQMNYRPTLGEEREIKKLAAESGAQSMSAFVNAVLDSWLPPLKTRRGQHG